MLLLNPSTVRFGTTNLPNITAIAIDRTPRRRVEDWSDLGPYATIADVPEQRIRIHLTQELTESDAAPPTPGQQATLSFYTAPARADSARKKFTATAVILEVKHEISQKRGATRTIVLAAISEGGTTDPIAVTDASNGEV
jgi:hypothetical protein